MNHRLYAIDPGPEFSALVVLVCGKPLPHVELAVKWPNGELLAHLGYLEITTADRLVIEQIEGMGLAVGKEVFETCFWSGRFAQAWHSEAWSRVTRRQVKLNLCGQMRAKDPHIRQALIDRFGPGKEVAVGKKKAPGPLFGIAGDCWSALACAVTWMDLQKEVGAR